MVILQKEANSQDKGVHDYSEQHHPEKLVLEQLRDVSAFLGLG